MDYIFKGVVGAGVVIFIAILSQSRYIYLAGLAPLFPTFALFAHVLSYHEGGAVALREVVYFGAFSIFPYLAYLLSVAFLIGRIGLPGTLVAGLVVWAATSAILVYSWNGLGFKNLVMGQS